jgi:hypothetical protein
MGDDWDEIQSYDDLLATNGKFLDGNLEMSPSHRFKIPEREHFVVPLLKKLQEHKIFIVDWVVAARHVMKTGLVYQHKNYLSFIVPKFVPHARDFINHLFAKKDMFKMSCLDVDAVIADANYSGKAALEYAIRETGRNPEIVMRKTTQWLPCTENIEDEFRDFDDYPNIQQILHHEGVYSIHICSREPMFQYIVESCIRFCS